MFFQVRVEIGVADNVWHQIRAKIALTVDDLGILGDEFRPLFRAGWLAYIHKTHGAAQPRQAQSVGQEPVVVEG